MIQLIDGCASNSPESQGILLAKEYDKEFITISFDCKSDIYINNKKDIKNYIVYSSLNTWTEFTKNVIDTITSKEKINTVLMLNPDIALAIGLANSLLDLVSFIDTIHYTLLTRDSNLSTSITKGNTLKKSGISKKTNLIITTITGDLTNNINMCKLDLEYASFRAKLLSRSRKIIVLRPLKSGRAPDLTGTYTEFNTIPSGQIGNFTNDNSMVNRNTVNGTSNINSDNTKLCCLKSKKYFITATDPPSVSFPGII